MNSSAIDLHLFAAEIQHFKGAPQKFLSAWKEGIKIVGEQFFNIKSSSVDKATNKWELAPNIGFIKKVINGYSHGHQALIALMCSFYSSVDGQQLLEQIEMKNFVDALAVIDLDAKEVMAELSLNYVGW